MIDIAKLQKDYNETEAYLFYGDGGITGDKTIRLIRQVLRALFFDEPIDDDLFDWLDAHGYLKFETLNSHHAKLEIDDNCTLDLILMSMVYDGRLERCKNEVGEWAYKLNKSGCDYVEKMLPKWIADSKKGDD